MILCTIVTTTAVLGGVFHFGKISTGCDRNHILPAVCSGHMFYWFTIFPQKWPNHDRAACSMRKSLPQAVARCRARSLCVNATVVIQGKSHEVRLAMSSADRRGPSAVFGNWLRTWARRYGFAVLSVAAATLVRYGLSVAFGSLPPFVIFLPAIILVAVLAGFGPGVLTTFLSAASIASFFWTSLNVFGSNRAREIVGLVLFCGVGTGVSGLGRLYRRRGSRLSEFERVVEGLEEMIVVVDRDYRYLIANRAFLSYRGMNREDLIGRCIPEILPPGVFEATIKDKLDECFGGKVVQYEMRYMYPSRGERDLVIWYFPIEGPNGVDRVASVLRDVTEQKRAEAAVRESEDRYRDLIEHSEDMVCTHDLSGKLLSVNPAPARLLGYEVEELLKIPMRDLIAPEFRSQFDQYIDTIREKRQDLGLLCVLAKDGRRRIWEYRNTLRTEGVASPVVRGIARDVTERKQAEDTVRRSEQRMRLFIEHAPVGTALLDRDMRYVQASRRWCQDYGLGDREIIGMSHYELFPEIPERWKEAHRRCLAGEVLREERDRFDRADGTVQWVRWELHPWYENGQIGGIAIFAEDVTAREVATDALRKSEERYRMLFEKTVAGVGIITLGGTVLDCNDAWARMFGCTDAAECRGSQMQNCYRDPAQREPLLAELRHKGVFIDREWELRRKDGTYFWVLLNSVLIPQPDGESLIQSTMFEITTRKRAEEALRRSEEDYRNFVARSSEGIFRQDLDAPIPIDLPEEELAQRILHDSYLAECNDAIVKMYGLNSAQDLLGRRLTEFVDPADRVNVELTREYIRSGFRVLERESHETDVNGNEKVFCNSMIGIVEDGKLVRTWGIQRDVTEQAKSEHARREAEQALRKSEERFRVALKDSPITVFSQDDELRYTWINNPQLHWQHNVVGKTDDEIIGSKNAAALNNLKRGVLTSGVGAREEVAIPQNGTSHVFDITIEPLFDAQRKVVGVTAACMDIARLREIADRLQESRDKLANTKSYLESEIQTELGFEKIIGQSPALREVLRKARVVSPTDSTVLLLGETGTGKELVARSVHALSARSDHTFVKLNCAAVLSGLLESELFGHEKGAFTGAVNQKAGRVELADKGTLFLDEIGEMPPELQPKLLRVLQDREFERLGGIRTLRVDVRIISATNRDLQQDVADKKFREDLFYRLHVFPIEMPPLRDRRDDIDVGTALRQETLRPDGEANRHHPR